MWGGGGGGKEKKKEEDKIAVYIRGTTYTQSCRCKTQNSGIVSAKRRHGRWICPA